MQAEVLEGALVTLKRLGVDDIDVLFEQFQTERLHQEAGLYNPPKKQSLIDVLEEDDLAIWQMIPEESTEPVGYAGIVTYSGPIYLFMYHFDESNVDLDLAQDAMTILTTEFFRQTKEEQLWTYQLKPVPDEILDRLLEGGFDHWDDQVPAIDYDKVACFIMERHTFDAYYGDEAEEDDDGFVDPDY